MKTVIGLILLLLIVMVVVVRRLRKAERARREAVRASENQLVDLLENLCAKKDTFHSARTRGQMFEKHRRHGP